MQEEITEAAPRPAATPAPYTTSQDPTAFHGQWWGHSKEHGWVVLDRSIAGNQPGLKQILFFMRCKDKTTFTTKRETWKPPAFVFAPNYLRSLVATEAAGATETLEGFKARWPELQREIQHQYEATLPKPVEPPAVVKKPRKKKAVAAATDATTDTKDTKTSKKAGKATSKAAGKEGAEVPPQDADAGDEDKEE